MQFTAVEIWDLSSHSVQDRIPLEGILESRSISSLQIWYAAGVLLQYILMSLFMRILCILHDTFVHHSQTSAMPILLI